MKTITIPISEYNELIRLRECVCSFTKSVQSKPKKINKKTVQKMREERFQKRLEKLGMG